MHASINAYVYGKCMGSVWEVYGMCMGSVWDVYGKCMGSAGIFSVDLSWRVFSIPSFYSLYNALL